MELQFLSCVWFRFQYIVRIYFIAFRDILKQILCERNTAQYDIDHNDIGRDKKLVAIVTGGSRGIGFEICRKLSAKSVHVVMASNHKSDAERAISTIKKENPSASVEYQHIDLGDLDSVRSFAKIFDEKNVELNLLINNAAVMIPDYSVTKQGFELQFGVNYLGHFLLTLLLLKKLTRSGSPDSKSRIINVSSVVHEMGYVNFKDLQGKSCYSAHFSYAQSKLALVLFSYELQRHLADRNVLVAAASPGVVNTNLYQNSLLHMIIKILGKYFLLSPAQGAATVLYAALSPDVEHNRGGYYDNCVKCPSSAVTYDTNLQNELWNLSHILTNLKLTEET